MEDIAINKEREKEEQEEIAKKIQQLIAQANKITIQAQEKTDEKKKITETELYKKLQNNPEEGWWTKYGITKEGRCKECGEWGHAGINCEEEEKNIKFSEKEIIVDEKEKREHEQNAPKEEISQIPPDESEKEKDMDENERQKIIRNLEEIGRQTMEKQEEMRKPLSRSSTAI